MAVLDFSFPQIPIPRDKLIVRIEHTALPKRKTQGVKIEINQKSDIVILYVKRSILRRLTFLIASYFKT